MHADLLHRSVSLRSRMKRDLVDFGRIALMRGAMSSPPWISMDQGELWPHACHSQHQASHRAKYFQL